MKATIHGRLKCLQKLIIAGADVNFADKLGQTALIHASIRGDHKAVTILLNAGADINAMDKWHGRPSVHKPCTQIVGQGALIKTCKIQQNQMC